MREVAGLNNTTEAQLINIHHSAIKLFFPIIHPLSYEHNGPSAEIKTQWANEKLTRSARGEKKQQRQVCYRVEGQKIKKKTSMRRRGKKPGVYLRRSWPGILMRPHSDSEMRVRSPHCGCQITARPQQEIRDRVWGRRGGRGPGAGGCQDYKFSSFRTAKRTEVENNPQPYPTQGGKLIKSLVTNRMPFPERSLKRMLVAN